MNIEWGGIYDVLIVKPRGNIKEIQGAHVFYLPDATTLRVEVNDVQILPDMQPFSVSMVQLVDSGPLIRALGVNEDGNVAEWLLVPSPDV